MYHLTFNQRLHSLLRERGIDAPSWEIRSLDVVDSTNNKVEELLVFYNNAVVLSKIQTQGRGRKGDFWHSPEGGLWLSIGTKIPIPVQELSTPVVEIVKSELEKYVNCDIKPPNDILIENKKVCGVLVETKISGQYLSEVIIGIGINVLNEIPEEIEEIATRMVDHCTPPYVHDLAADIATEIVLLIDKLQKSV